MSNFLMNREFLLRVERGEVSGHRLISRYGRNPDIDVGAAEDVWNNGGLYTGFPTGSAEAIEIFSSSANDTAAGTGARTVQITGLDASNNPQTVSGVALNGTTPVAVSGTWKRVFTVSVETAGSGGSNAGTLTVRHSVTTANVFSVMAVGLNFDQFAGYTVPTGKKIYVLSLDLQIGATAAAGIIANFAVAIRPSGGVFNVIRTWDISDTQGRTVPGNYFSLTAGTDVLFRVLTVSANNTPASVGARFIEVDD